jgi:hypothetical protein
MEGEQPVVKAVQFRTFIVYVRTLTCAVVLFVALLLTVASLL